VTIDSKAPIYWGMSLRWDSFLANWFASMGYPTEEMRRVVDELGSLLLINPKEPESYSARDMRLSREGFKALLGPDAEKRVRKSLSIVLLVESNFSIPCKRLGDLVDVPESTRCCPEFQGAKEGTLLRPE
jgi:hypothetical protein